MNNKDTNDGGPAFPSRADDLNGDPKTGMTLRDYFAAKALHAMLSTYRETLTADCPGDTSTSTFYRDMAIDGGDGCREIATDAYLFADAMLAAREGK